jgi:NitT/TauT family transport system substrate-binding protein
MHLRTAPLRSGTLVSALAIALGLLASPSRAEQVSFLPHWVPQAQFAGYFVARDKGIYKRHGLDVDIRQGGPGIVPSDSLAAGSVDFASLWLADGIQKRAGGAPIRLIAQVEQKSALMFVAKKSSGISRPRDIDGRKVGLWSRQFRLQPQAFFKKYDLTATEVPQSYSVNLFLRGGVDVASAMWYNEYHTILNSGYNPDELTTFFFHEHDLNFPEAGLYAREQTVEESRERCRRFVAASFEGWRYAFEHPEEALDIVLHYMERAHIPANRVHQRWMLNCMKELTGLAEAEGEQGVLNKEGFERVARALKRNGLITVAPSYQTLYRNCHVVVEE